ncbi:MAG: carboxypeptidase regulatory-like domain-containing protein [Bacteroidia bacterium]|jgi:hypothetical protein|nr:carboxypeptidase regulatory-like domain-containing protein [Bacteroidia bacterium]
MKKVYSLFMLLLAFCLGANAQSQLGEIRGKVTDGSTKKPMELVSITLELNGIVKARVYSDDDGDYIIKPLSPGNYTVKVSFIGYDNVTIDEVTVISDQVTYQNITMNPKGQTLREVVIKRRRPLVDPDNLGNTITSQTLMRLPQRSANMVANLTAGVDARAGGTPNIRGARADGTAYYIDGVRVQAGSVAVPQAAIDQIQTITSGTPAQFGDFTGGVIAINTRAPSKTWMRSVEFISASPFFGWAGDNSNFNQFEGYVAGPLLMANKGRDNERVLLGFSFAGNIIYSQDGRPSAVDMYRANDAAQARIERTPLTRTSTGGFVPSGEFLTKSDLVKVDQRQNVANYAVNIQGNLAFQPSSSTSIRIGYQGNHSRGRNFSFANSLLNADNNQLSVFYGGRVYAQFTQTFAKKQQEGEKEKPKPQTVSNFYYTVRASYEVSFNESMNPEFQRDFFNYGYLGTFTTYQARTFGRVGRGFGQQPDAFGYQKPDGTTDTIYLSSYVRNFGLVDTAYTFQPGDINTVRGNYTQVIYDFFGSQGQNVRSLSQLRGLGGLINGDQPLGIYSNMWSSPGTLQGNYSKNMAEVLSLYVMSEATVAPKKNPKAKHDLQFGMMIEQQYRRGYGLNANGLWSLSRLLVNNQFQGLDSAAYTLKFDQFGNFQDTVLFQDRIDPNQQSNFDRNLRQKLISQGATDVYGNPIDQFSRLDVNAYRPNVYSLDMFTANELLNNGNSFVSYFGYDHLGNRVRGRQNIDAFLNDPNNRTLGAYAPNYAALWFQDKFVFKDLIVRAGVRVERFDANQLVLRDPYSLVPIYSAGDVRRGNLKGLASSIPSNIGDDFKIYVDNQSPNASSNVRITGFRNGNDWYDKDGNPVTDPSALWRDAKRENSQAPDRNTPFLVTDGQEIPTQASFRDYRPDVKVSPRIWFSFPISSTSQFFGTYDVLAQRPTESNVAQFDDYFFLNNRRTGIIANPDLRMTQVIDYEIGFRQQVGDNSALAIVASYREFRNLIQLYRYVQAYPFEYTSFGNLDFSTVKSFRLEYELRDLGNINISANYMLQFAEGTGSNSQSSAALVQVGLPTLRNIFPLDFDTRHTLKGVIDYHYRTGKDYNGPIVKGKKILENAGVNFIFNYVTGRPYTQTLIAVPEVQSGVVARSQVKGTINGANLPPQFYLDMTIDKNFEFKKEKLDGKTVQYRLRVFLWVQNLLDAANVLGVYAFTGSAYDDGYLASPQSQEQLRVATNAQSFVDLYNTRVVNPGFFALPRLTRIGASLYF